MLRGCLEGLSNGRLTPAQARLVLAARGIRTTQKALEQALRWQPAVVPDLLPGRKPRLKPLDDLPLTPERLRHERNTPIPSAG